MSADGERSGSARPVSAEGVGGLVAMWDTNALEQRRSRVLRRLRELRDGEGFASLPEDLRERIREIVAAEDEV